MINALLLVLFGADGQIAPPPDPNDGRPHTLIVSDGDSMTRIDYKTGTACKRARDAIIRQTQPPQNTPGVIYGRSRTTAYCVPR